MYHKVYYNESKPKLINPTKFKNTYVKIIVEGECTPQKLSQLVDRLSDAKVHDVKVVATPVTQIEGDVNIEVEDTLTTITNCVHGLEDNVNKEQVIEIFKSLYVEAQEV